MIMLEQETKEESCIEKLTIAEGKLQKTCHLLQPEVSVVLLPHQVCETTVLTVQSLPCLPLIDPPKGRIWKGDNTASPPAGCLPPTYT